MLSVFQIMSATCLINFRTFSKLSSSFKSEDFWESIWDIFNKTVLLQSIFFVLFVKITYHIYIKNSLAFGYCQHENSRIRFNKQQSFIQKITVSLTGAFSLINISYLPQNPIYFIYEIYLSYAVVLNRVAAEPLGALEKL